MWQGAQQNWSVDLKPGSPVISTGSHVGAFPGQPGCFTGSQRLSAVPCFLRAAGVTSWEDGLPYWCASSAVPWVTLCSQHLPTCSYSPWPESLQVSSRSVAGCPSRNNQFMRLHPESLSLPSSASWSRLYFLILIYLFLAAWRLFFSARALSSRREWGLFSGCGVQVSDRGDFSCGRAWTLKCVGFSSCGSRA